MMASTDQEMNMTAPLSDTFKAQLLALRAEAVAQLQSQRGGAVGRAEAAADALASASDDQASADTQRGLAFALEERESAELVAIDAALQRIADSSYGLCVDCGVSIPTARLHANPAALRCVNCQTALEKRQGNA
jgi:DnaK suppressor protein